MSDSERPTRVYGEKEIGRILKRATELQQAEPSPPATGMTLSDLEEIAAEAGIDGRHLRRAALEVDAGIDEPGPWTLALGDELRVVREVTLPGELTESGFERLVAVIQTTAGVHGQPSLLGGTLTWRATSPTNSRTLQVVVSSRNGETHLRIEENLNQLAGGLFGGMLGGVGGGFGFGVGVPAGLALGSPLLAVAFPTGIVGLTYLACRAIYRATVRKRRTAANELLDRMVASARDSLEAASG